MWTHTSWKNTDKQFRVIGHEKLSLFYLMTDLRRSHLVLIGENWLVKIGWAWHVMTGLGTPGICTYWPLSRKQPFWHFLTLSSCWIPSTKKQPNLPCGKTHLTQSSWPNKVPQNKRPRPLGIHDIKVISPTKQISFQGLRLHGPRFFMSNPLRRWCLHQNPFQDPMFFPRCTRTIGQKKQCHYDANLPAVFLLAFFKFPSGKNCSPKNNRSLWVLPKRCFRANSIKVKWNLRARTKIVMILVPLWTRVWGRPQCFK